MSDMPFRGLKSERKWIAFSGKRDELAKRACCAKRVHQYSLYVSVSLKNSLSALTVLSEFIFWGWTLILLLNYLWLSEAESLSPGNLNQFFCWWSRAKSSFPGPSAIGCSILWANRASLAKLPTLSRIFEELVPLNVAFIELSANPCGTCSA